MKLPLMRTCREVAEILVAQEDRVLPVQERIALRIHLTICTACPRFEKQILTMRNAMRQWRNYTESGESG